MADDPRIGTQLGDYQIEGVIGRGGMGVVYLAEQQRPRRKVAIKVLAPELIHDESFRERFEFEWQTAAAIEHPNIIPLYQAGEADGVLYISMRYVEGTDLKALLERNGPLGSERALAIIAQVAAALDAAHAKGLVHRDVKPANVLISSGPGTSDSDHVYLTDFGVAKETARKTGWTRTGFFVGTIDYAAPEQIEGKALDARTDEYALGCLLYECLTGIPPFRKDSEVAVLLAHLMEPPPSITVARTELPPALDAVLARAMAKSPDERYATCREFVAAAQAALRAPTAQQPTVVGETVVAPGETVVAGAATVPGAPATPTAPGAPQAPTAPGAPSGPVPAETIVGATAPPLAGPGVGGPPAPPSYPTSPGAAPSFWRSRKAAIGAAVVALAAIGGGVGAVVATSSGGDKKVEPSPPAEPPAPSPQEPSPPGPSPVPTDSTDETQPQTEPVEPPPTPPSEPTPPTPPSSPSGLIAVSLPAGSPPIAFEAASNGNVDVYAATSAGTVRLTNSPGIDSAPRWSSAGQIAFASGRTGNYDIVVMDADGGNQTVVTSDPSDDISPAWSADGARLAYVSQAGGDAEIWLVDPSAPNPVQLTDNDVQDTNPTWSPDGIHVVFTRIDGDAELVSIDLETGEETVLTDNDALDDFASFSPDGTQIAFTTNRDGNFEVYVMGSDGSDQTRLTDDEAEDARPAWYPDGSRIAFQSTRDGNYELYAARPDGSDLLRLTNDDADEFGPSPQPEQTGTPPDVTDTGTFTDTGTLTDTGGEEPFPNLAEQELLSHVPEKFRDNCGREAETTRGFGSIAGVDCPTNGPVRAFYELFPTVESMNDYYASQLDAASVQRNSGDCQAGNVGENFYTQPVDGQQVRAGRFACYFSDQGQPIFIWTNQRFRILGFALRTDGGRLYQWWTGAGPF
ncbi:MAG: protein kinase [Thermoleophilia bacterium]